MTNVKLIDTELRERDAVVQVLPAQGASTVTKNEAVDGTLNVTVFDIATTTQAIVQQYLLLIH